MEDEWGIFDDVNRPIMTTTIKSKHGHKVSTLRDILRGVSTSADDNTAIGNLLKEYDRYVCYLSPSQQRMGG